MATDRTGQTFATIFPALVQWEAPKLADSEGTEINNPQFTNVDIDGGAIDGTPIGQTSADKVSATQFGTGTFLSIADDDFQSVSPPETTGILLIGAIGSAQQDASGLIVYRVTSSGNFANVIAQPASSLEASAITGAPTGTSGTDGKVTVFASDDGNVYVENRSGSGLSYNYTIFSR